MAEQPPGRAKPQAWVARGLSSLPSMFTAVTRADSWLRGPSWGQPAGPWESPPTSLQVPFPVAFSVFTQLANPSLATPSGVAPGHDGGCFVHFSASCSLGNPGLLSVSQPQLPRCPLPPWASSHLLCPPICPQWHQLTGPSAGWLMEILSALHSRL